MWLFHNFGRGLRSGPILFAYGYLSVGDQVGPDSVQSASIINVSHMTFV